MTVLAALLRYRAGLLVLSLVTWTVGFCLPLLTGLANQAIFDRLAGQATLPLGLWALFGVLVVIAVVRPIVLMLWFWVHVTYETTLEALVRTNLFDWLLARVGRKRPAPPSATLVGNLRDDVPGHTDVVNEWYRLSGEAVFAVVALIVMGLIDPLVTVLTFVPLAGVVVATHWMRSRLPLLWGETRDHTTALTGLLADVFGGVQAVQAAGAESAVVARVREINTARADAEVRSQVARVRIDALSDAIVVVGQGLVLVIAAGAMVAGRFSVGDFLLFTLYLDWMMMLPRRVGRLLSQRAESGRAVGRLTETMADGDVTSLVQHRQVHLSGPLPTVPALSAPSTGPGRLRELTLHDVTFVHPGSGEGVRDVDLTLTAGTFTVVVGEVGAGKSTMLEVLLGLRAADSGDIRWNGETIADLAEFMAPPRVAYKPQLPRLFSASLRDNVLLGLPDDPHALQGALRQAAFTTELDAGLDTDVGPRGVRLSGGQVQRAGAARMFVRGPELHVVDDLFSALDEDTEREIWTRLDEARAARADATYLVVSHRAAALRRADQVVVLGEGRVRARGPLDSVRDDPAVRSILGRPPSDNDEEENV